MLGLILGFLREAIREQVVKDPYWATAALTGQLVFGGRFILQWIVSEYKKKSHVPTAFWFMSLVGSIILLGYSIHIKNPIFILGFSLNSLIYLRNLQLIYRGYKGNKIPRIIEVNEDFTK